MTKTSVFIADNHLLVREGIKGILSGKNDLDIVGEASRSSELKAALQLRECFFGFEDGQRAIQTAGVNFFVEVHAGCFLALG